MKLSSMHLVLAAGYMTRCAEALGTFKLDFTKERRAVTHLGKRGRPFEVPLVESSLYLINVTVGIPPQTISLNVDTGSSNTWFPSVDSNPCQAANGSCVDGVAFDPNESSSLRYLSNGSFAVAYGTGQATGDYISDSVKIGPATINNLTLGLAANLSAPFANGLLGMGYDSLETLAASSGIQFPGVLTRLKQAGVIARRAFSVYLDDQEAGVGSILFGGIDTSKYTGDLVAVAITPNGTGVYDRYRVDLTAVSFLDSAGKSTLLSPANMSAPCAVDTGASYNILPASVSQALVEGLGAVSYAGVYFVDCALRDSNTSVLFQFGGPGGPIIRVPISEMLGVPLGFTFNDGRNGCQLYVGQVDDAELQSLLLAGFTIGDPVIRSAYVVYDVDNNEIYLAQAAFNRTGKGKVQEIAAGSGLPGVTSTATATASSFPTAFPPSILSEISVSLVSNQTASSPGLTATTQLPTTPTSPSFDIAAITGSAATTTSTSSAAASRSFDAGIDTIAGAIVLLFMPWITLIL
ncbi:putative aspartic-type endopeptidase OPSB [Cladophialophora carrionii]|uniref:Putative aspartic-type endopeptidase OPSB n=1 Tax=Cladophialophora carrionii TaxID=86049 RepID=A0A1C1CH77_9EURO|nr:putative aspartic-type endopeptidase OPSB [Cladophialophora carrionii]